VFDDNIAYQQWLNTLYPDNTIDNPQQQQKVLVDDSWDIGIEIDMSIKGYISNKTGYKDPYFKRPR
jgi:hypothetical protein